MDTRAARRELGWDPLYDGARDAARDRRGRPRRRACSAEPLGARQRLADPLRDSLHLARRSSYLVRGQKKPRRPSLRRRGTTCTCRWGTLWLTTLLIATKLPWAPIAAGTARASVCAVRKERARPRRRSGRAASRDARAGSAGSGRGRAGGGRGRRLRAARRALSSPACGRQRRRRRGSPGQATTVSARGLDDQLHLVRGRRCSRRRPGRGTGAARPAASREIERITAWSMLSKASICRWSAARRRAIEQARDQGRHVALGSPGQDRQRERAVVEADVLADPHRMGAKVGERIRVLHDCGDALGAPGRRRRRSCGPGCAGSGGRSPRWRPRCSSRGRPGPSAAGGSRPAARRWRRARPRRRRRNAAR